MTVVKGTNYFGNFVKADQILQGSPNYNVEVSEGQNPPGEFYPAGYLPIVLDENRVAGSGYVILPGKVLAYDSNKRIAPAGLAMDWAMYSAAYSGDHEAAQAAPTVYGHKYGNLDEQHGIVTAVNTRAQAGEFVCETLIDAGISFTAPIGISRYSKLTPPGSNPSNPSTFYKHAYDTGGGMAYSRWCYIQIPVIEVNPRLEAVRETVTHHRIRLYPNGKVQIWDTQADAVIATCTEVYSPQAFSKIGEVGGPATPDAAPTQFAVVGRTVFFNNVVPANWGIKYLPKVDLPFTGLIVGSPDVIVTDESGMTEAAFIKDYIGEEVGFDFSSNFRRVDTLANIGSGYNMKVGRILDYKNGSNEDLKLVRSYFRDFGLWQEQPGDATDGRNTQLSIVNAPKWIARIAVNFESGFTAI